MMAKRVEAKPEGEGEDHRTHKAFGKSKHVALMKDLDALDGEAEETNKGRKELLEDAKKDGYHPAAGAIIRKLRKLRKDKGTAAVNELLFHLDVGIEHEGFRQPDMLEDRQPPMDPDNPGERDLRPRHLRAVEPTE